MKRILSAKSVAAAAVVLGTLGAATAAHARSDVFLSIGVQVPGAYGHVQTAPVYATPRPVVVQPQYGANAYGWDDRAGWRHHRPQRASFRGPWGDYDRDGVANRFDRFPANPYRR
ncbi:MAG: hypothetical protein NDJ19_02065 [Ramlibacter sp.]|nr:hypothetical protein [Ramlibacter sp.]